MEFSPKGGNGTVRASSDAVRRICSRQPRVQRPLRLRRVLMSDPMYASYGAGRGKGDEICRDDAGAGGRFKKI